MKKSIFFVIICMLILIMLFNVSVICAGERFVVSKDSIKDNKTGLT